jgi:hypothetical protein
LLIAAAPLACGRCIPIRYPGEVPTPDTVEVLLISSRGGKGKGWVFPKVQHMLLQHLRAC